MQNNNDLKKAIQEHVLIRSENGFQIIAKEGEEITSEWLFDFRAIILKPIWLNHYANIFWEKYATQYPFQVAGMETVGIALVAAIVMKGFERGTPVNGFFIRKTRKRQGLMKMIEGSITADPIILVDDLMNSGQTIAKQIEIISYLDLKISDVFVFILYRDEKAYEFLTKKKIAFSSIFNLEDFNIPLLKIDDAKIPKDYFQTIWHFTPPDPSFHLVVQKSAPILDGKYIYYGSDAGFFRALDQDSGNVIWEFRIGHHPKGKGILSSPTLYNDVVYFGAYDGNLYALNSNTGEICWKYDEADWIGSSPSIAPNINLIFIGLEFGLLKKRGGIAAICLKTGKRAWVQITSSFTHGSPLYILKEELVVIGSNDGIVYAYEAKTGNLKWEYQTGGDIKTSFAYDPKRRLIFFGSMDSVFYAISATNGKLIFSKQTGGGIYSTPLVHDDIVYVASLDKSLYALNINTFDCLWTFETAGRIFSSPVFIENSIWIGSNDGRMYEINPISGKLLSFFQVTERITNKIAYNHNTKRFFVPTCANEIYCIKKNI